MKELLILTFIISFFTTLIFLPKWIRKTKDANLIWEDMNKYNSPKNVASSGGLIVILAFTLGVLSYIAIRTFIIQEDGTGTQILAMLSSILILAIIGLTDDLLGWKEGGLSIKFRIFLVLFASIPLIVINAGHHLVNIPFFGEVNLGLIYPLILIPMGILGATVTYNILAGFNGLEASQGIIIISFLSFVAYQTGSSWLSIIGLCMVASLIAFYIFNKFPASVFPGDIMTYAIGALISIMAILGNFERIAVLVFTPYIIVAVLKIRGKLKKQSFGKPNPDGSLELPYEKIYSLTHLGIFLIKKFKEKAYEEEVVYLINAFQIFVIIVTFLLFRQYIMI